VYFAARRVDSSCLEVSAVRMKHGVSSIFQDSITSPTTSDTVDTASRMKSTGIPRKIQVSQSTADCLILGGKQHWLVPRMEKVYAKGKGEVQTYFLEIRGGTEKNG